MSGTLFRGGVYNLVPNNNPILIPNAAWTIGIKIAVPFAGVNGYPNINEWGCLLSSGWFNTGFNEIKWYLNTYNGFISTNYGVKDQESTGTPNLGGCVPANHPIPKGYIWLFLRRKANGSWGEAYVEEGDTFANFFSATAPSTLTGAIGGMTGGGGSATEWYIGNIPDFQNVIARTYWASNIIDEFFISTHEFTDAEMQALATLSTPTTVAAQAGGQANLLRHYKFSNAPDTLIDLSNNNKNGVWVAPDYGASIAPWYPTVSKLAVVDQVVTDPTYATDYTRSFAAVSNSSNFTDTGLTVVSGAFQVRSNILIANAINTRSRVRLSTIPQDTVYLRAEYLNVWNADGDPTYVGIGLSTADGANGYEIEGGSGGFTFREIKAGTPTLTATFVSQGDDLNRTYAVELDDGFINFYTKASGSSTYVLRGRMVNTVGGQLYPTYISETTTGGLGKGAQALTFKTAPAVGGQQGGGGGPTTIPGINLDLRDISTVGIPFLPEGTSVQMSLLESTGEGAGVYTTYNGTVGANGVITFTDNTWANGQEKRCFLEASGIGSPPFVFTVEDITV